jgi:hypothetical protein
LLWMIRQPLFAPVLFAFATTPCVAPVVGFIQPQTVIVPADGRSSSDAADPQSTLFVVLLPKVRAI